MSWDLDSLISEDDIIFEQSLLKDPYKSSLWLEYYESNELESIYKKVFILSRAVTFIPNDIQLWSMYLDLRVSAAITTGTSLRSLRAINSLFTKALSHVESIELWLKYLQFLLDTQISSITFIRRQFNACLAATPINQHNSIWHLYLNFASIVKGITAVKIYKNFLKFITPAELASSSEFEISLYEVIINLIKFGGVSESMDIFKVITKNPENFTQLEISQFQLWIDVLGELVDDGGTQVEDSLIDELVAVGLKKFPDQISKFYLKQADFYEKKQLYSKVRFLLNRGLTECVTVNDFVLIFEAFTEFEERVIEKLIEAGEETESVISLRMAFLEELLENRSIYLSNMMIKQDPNNLDEWFNRISIYESKNDINKVLNTFAEALTTINPLKSHSLSSNTSNTLPKLWISYSNVYASNGDYKTASIILSKSIQSQFQTPDELVELYLEWSQLELKRGEDESAVKVVEDVCLYIPTKTSSTNKNDEVSYTDSSIDIHTRLHKSSKLWNYYLDLLESFTEDGTPIEIDRVSRAYDKLILLKLITPSIL